MRTRLGLFYLPGKLTLITESLFLSSNHSCPELYFVSCEHTALRLTLLLPGSRMGLSLLFLASLGIKHIVWSP